MAARLTLLLLLAAVIGSTFASPITREATTDEVEATTLIAEELRASQDDVTEVTTERMEIETPVERDETQEIQADPSDADIVDLETATRAETEEELVTERSVDDAETTDEPEFLREIATESIQHDADSQDLETRDEAVEDEIVEVATESQVVEREEATTSAPVVRESETEILQDSSDDVVVDEAEETTATEVSTRDESADVTEDYVESTTEVLSEKFFRSGDVGQIDEEAGAFTTEIAVEAEDATEILRDADSEVTVEEETTEEARTESPSERVESEILSDDSAPIQEDQTERELSVTEVPETLDAEESTAVRSDEGIQADESQDLEYTTEISVEISTDRSESVSYVDAAPIEIVEIPQSDDAEPIVPADSVPIEIVEITEASESVTDAPEVRVEATEVSTDRVPVVRDDEEEEEGVVSKVHPPNDEEYWLKMQQQQEEERRAVEGEIQADEAEATVTETISTEKAADTPASQESVVDGQSDVQDAEVEASASEQEPQIVDQLEKVAQKYGLTSVNQPKETIPEKSEVKKFSSDVDVQKSDPLYETTHAKDTFHESNDLQRRRVFGDKVVRFMRSRW